MTKSIIVVVCALCAIPLSGAAQPAARAGDNDTESRLIDHIGQIQSRTGPGDAALIQPLAELADYYHETGNYALAVPVIERALGLIRTNFGLSSLDQAPLLQLAVRNERARGNVAAAWDTEKELLSLARDNPEDLRTVPILREIGDGRIVMLERYVAGDYVPEVQLGCFYKAPRHHMASCYAGSKSDAASSILTDASAMYLDAAEVIRRLDIYPSTDLTELEITLARNFFLHGPPRTADSAYELGRASLRRLYDYEVEHSGALLDRIGALVRIADWDLVYVRQPQAIEIYERALDRLKAGGATQADIARLFAPQTPVVIPSFLGNPLNSSPAGDAAGYVEVVFEVTRYGRSRKIAVREITGDVPGEAIEELTQTIRLARFRPRIDSAGRIDDTTVTVRYYADGRD